MDDLGIIDQFLATFTTYIDSGFGLLGADVHYLTAVLIAIDITLAGLYWAIGPDNNIIASFIKKVLYVGFFALILNNFSFLSGVIFESFGGLGLKASGSSFTPDDLMRPGYIANTGFAAAHPLLDEIGTLTGPVKFFTNIVTIFVLFLAWIITLFAFFFLAIQLFVTILEFKLTTLAGFVLIPFALWNKTSFLAERVLGNVMASGIKLMVLAIIIGIGSTLFGQVTSGFTAGAVTLEDAGTVILASLALFALGIFCPGIAAGLVSGAPQLGAGAAVGAAAAVGAGAMAGGALAKAGTQSMARGSIAAVQSGASLSGGTRMAYSMGKLASGQSGLKGAAAGMGTVIHAGAGSIAHSLKGAAAKITSPIQAKQVSGARGAITATGGKITSGSKDQNIPANDGSTGQAPYWAQNAKSRPMGSHASVAATQALRDGDRGGSAEGPRLKQDEE